MKKPYFLTITMLVFCMSIVTAQQTKTEKGTTKTQMQKPVSFEKKDKIGVAQQNMTKMIGHNLLKSYTVSCGTMIEEIEDEKIAMVQPIEILQEVDCFKEDGKSYALINDATQNLEIKKLQIQIEASEKQSKQEKAKRDEISAAVKTRMKKFESTKLTNKQ